MKISAVIDFRFCAGHRLLNHESLCKYLHGHNYTVQVHVSAPKLDEVGRVIDFSVLEETLGLWLSQNWDHSFIVSHDDFQALEALRCIPEQRIFELPYNPTAENMARYLFEHVLPKVFCAYEISIDKVILWETENCFVEVMP